MIHEKKASIPLIYSERRLAMNSDESDLVIYIEPKSLVFGREFNDWHLQWGNGFLQITRQRLVGS